VDMSTREIDGALIVDLAGRLDTETSSLVSEKLDRIVQGGTRKVVLNLDQLDYVSSAGLRVILKAAKALQSSRGEIKICRANGLVKEVMEISGFDQILLTYDTESDALAAFNAP